MIRAWFRRRRDKREAETAWVRSAMDLLLRRCGDDLHRAFWRAHDRADAAETPARVNREWRRIMDEINRRRPPRRSHADTATRMLFLDRRD